MSTSIVQARITTKLLEQLSADAEALGLGNTSEALREGIVLLHRKAELVRLAQSYDDFYGGTPTPASEVAVAVAVALWGSSE